MLDLHKEKSWQTIFTLHRKLDALRCGACGAIFKATLPTILATQSRAMPETKALVGIFKYKGGMPFYRFDMLQDTFGTRISKSELWEMVADVADSAIQDSI